MQRRFLFCLALISLALFCGSSAYSQDWNQQLSQGVRALNAGRLIEARQYLEGAYELVRGTNDDEPRAQVIEALAAVCHQQGELVRASSLLETRQNILRTLHGAESVELANNMIDMGGVLLDRGKWPEAREIIQASLAMHRKLAGGESIGTARALLQLGMLDLIAGKFAEAEKTLIESIGTARKLLDPDNPSLISADNNLAKAYAFQGRFPEAAQILRRSLTASYRLGDHHVLVAESAVNLGVVYQLMGDAGRAEPLFKTAARNYEMLGGPEAPMLAIVLSRQAITAAIEHKYETAEKLFQRALVILKKTYGLDDVQVATTSVNLAETLYRQGKYSQAETVILEALRVELKFWGEGHVNTAIAYADLAAIYRQQQRKEDAEASYRKANAIFERIAPGSVGHTALLSTYAQFLKENHKPEAREIAARAKDLKRLR